MNSPIPNTLKSIVVLYGGVGPERPASLVSGKAVAEALSTQFPVELVQLDREELPESIDPKQSIVFPALHGIFGEDGRLQKLLEDRGIEYCGSESDDGLESFE